MTDKLPPNTLFISIVVVVIIGFIIAFSRPFGSEDSVAATVSARATEANATAQAAETTIAEAHAAAQAAKATAQVLETEIAQPEETEATAQAAKATAQMLETQLAEAHVTAQAAEATAQALETEIVQPEKTETTAQTAEATARELETQLEEANAAVQLAEATARELETQLEEANAAARTAEARVQLLETQLAEANAAAQTAETRVQLLETQLAEANAAAQTAEARVQLLETQLAEANIPPLPDSSATPPSELYPPVTLVFPTLDDPNFLGRDDKVELRWEWDGNLKEDEYFFIVGQFETHDQNRRCTVTTEYSEKTKEEKLIIPIWVYDQMCDSFSHRRMEGSISVAQFPPNSEKPSILLSATSATWSFVWEKWP